MAIYRKRNNQNRTDVSLGILLMFGSFCTQECLNHLTIFLKNRTEKERFELPYTSHVQRHILTHYDVLSSASAFLLYRIHHRQ